MKNPSSKVRTTRHRKGFGPSGGVGRPDRGMGTPAPRGRRSASSAGKEEKGGGTAGREPGGSGWHRRAPQPRTAGRRGRGRDQTPPQPGGGVPRTIGPPWQGHCWRLTSWRSLGGGEWPNWRDGKMATGTQKRAMCCADGEIGVDLGPALGRDTFSKRETFKHSKKSKKSNGMTRHNFERLCFRSRLFSLKRLPHPLTLPLKPAQK